MPDTLTAPASSGTAAVPAIPATPAAAAPLAPVAAPAPTSSIADAGAALKQAGSWNDAGFPEVADTSLGDGVADPTKPAAPAVPAAEAPEFSQDADGRWHRADGTFATTDEIAAIDAQIAAEATAPVVPAADPAKPEEPKANVVTLRTRDGQTKEVEVDDPELAQLIQQNFNDGMRRSEYVKKMADVETLRSEFTEFRAMLAANPEGVILQHLPPERQISIATQLLAQHFDALIPIIQKYDLTPGERIAAVAEAQTKLRTQQGDYDNLVASQRQAQDVRQAVALLVPDTADDAMQEKFWKLASLELTAAVDRGIPVTKESVKQLLADTLSYCGFDTAAGGSPAAPSRPRIALVPPASPASVPAAPATSSPALPPANDAAKALADAKATQRRIRLNQANRANAAAVPPVGAGAAPVRLPPVAPGASIEEASRALKGQRSWAS